MDALVDDVHTEINEPGLSKWGIVEEIVRRLRAGGMSDISIRAMLVDQKPVQGPPAGWPQPSVIVGSDFGSEDGSALVVMTFDEDGPRIVGMTSDPADIHNILAGALGEEEMASDVAEVMRGLTHESELRAERVRLGADEDRMRRSFTRG